MTTIAALRANVPYTLAADFYSFVIRKRNLTADAECTTDIINSSEFKGAMADCLRQIIIYPSSISEGGMSISKADRQSLLGEANRLYRSIGEESIDERPKITCY